MQKKMILKCTENTFIDSLLSDTNYAKEKVMYAGVYQDQVVYRTLLNVDIKALPENCVIDKAELMLYCNQNDFMEQQAELEVYNVQEPWSAEEVTWANQPNFDKTQKAISTIHCEYWENISWDVTSLIKKMQESINNSYGLLIKASDETKNFSVVGFLSQTQVENQCACIEITFTVENENYESKNTVAILTSQFFEWNGARCIFGGRERYLIDLVKLLERLGYSVDVYQPSNGDYWERSYAGVTIKAISSNSDVHEDFFVELNEEFHKLTQNYKYHIYFNLDVAYPNIFPGSICIGHGIWWDYLGREYWRQEDWYAKIFEVFKKTDLFVSIDTNIINWLKAIYPQATCKKVYVPNYVDLSIFRLRRRKAGLRPYPKRLKPLLNKQQTTFLYPRRLDPERGWSICKEVARELVTQYKNIKFLFVGRGNEQAEKNMELLNLQHPRIEYRWYEMDDMHKAYHEADVVLIPSLSSGGTSLALLEAMACGKPVIGGLVGGHTDLVIDGYNGFLINVDKQSLKEAILQFVYQPRLKREMGLHARKVAENFSKQQWEARWEAVLREHFPL